jgi:dihydrofolate reductase
MRGGTTFHFVTGGIHDALERARRAAGDRDVAIGGGADVAQQYVRAGLVDEIQVHVAPLLLGDGARLFESMDGRQTAYESVRVIHSPAASHYRYRLRK